MLHVMRKSKSEWLAVFQRIAEFKDGQCISRQYTNQRTKLDFVCDLGHSFSALPVNVLHKQSWCPHCAGNASLTISDMNVHAAKFGGRCMSSEYVNENTKLQWECTNGHRFKATSRSLRCQYCFCKECQKLTLAEFQKLAESIGYRLLSEEYKNNYAPIRLLCDVGHLWTVQPRHFKQGRRCFECSRGIR